MTGDCDNEEDRISDNGRASSVLPVNLKWYPVGDENPYTAPILDIRDFTLNMTSTTQSPAIAASYTANRSDDGSRFIGQTPTDFSTLPCALSYPHNGETLEGVVFKSPQMEIKWDIYAFGNFFYFVRSWTGDLVYKVKYENTGSSLDMVEILTNYVTAPDDTKIAEQAIHSIMQTHTLGGVWPFHISAEMADATEQDIAMYMFSTYGSKATLVTKANVLEIKLIEQPSP